MNENSGKYDLEKRTTRFSGEVIMFAKKLKRDIINNPLISQLVRAASSVGANYYEANGASSKKDFRNKIYICKKECRETKYWLEVIANNNPECKDESRELWKEAQELTLIFSKILITIEKKKQIGI
jgi:four helix bundle protein